MDRKGWCENRWVLCTLTEPEGSFQDLLSILGSLEETTNCWQSCKVGSVLKADNYHKNDIWAATTTQCGSLSRLNDFFLSFFKKSVLTEIVQKWAAILIMNGYSVKGQFTQNCSFRSYLVTCLINWLQTQQLQHQILLNSPTVLIHKPNLLQAARRRYPVVQPVEHLFNQWVVHNLQAVQLNSSTGVVDPDPEQPANGNRRGCFDSAARIVGRECREQHRCIKCSARAWILQALLWELVVRGYVVLIPRNYWKIICSEWGKLEEKPIAKVRQKGEMETAAFAAKGT